ncbi:MAG TPA: metallophosphoesterase [Blastocatellia bacterium]|nr:metallophosphoesterase [Blastocatellia bacterium]
MRRRDFLALLSATTAAAYVGRAVAQSSQAPVDNFRFVAFGDMGTGESNQLSLAHGMTTYHSQHPFDTVLMLGDNIYPNGSSGLFKEKFERPYAELLNRDVRFYAALGNHDVRQGLKGQINYSNFNMGGKPYYSFVKGNGLVEFFALDSTNMDRRQIGWMGEALAASRAAWKIAYFHHPIYSSGITHGSDTKLRELIEPLLVKHGVAAALSGHDHIYERTKPQRGVQYFISGTGGQLRKGDIDRRTPHFAAGNDRVNSYMCFEATADKLSYSALDAAGHTLDSGSLTRGRNAFLEARRSSENA